jgi:signal transduction histidine kinase
MTLKELEQEKQIRTSLFKITHEIKNPIAVCKGYLDMFDVNNIEHSKKYIPILREEIERTLILLQDFLCMTKIKIDKEIIDINMVLEDVTDNFIPILKDKNIIGDFNISENSVYMYGDYNRLTQAFINIIKNSVEAIDSNRGGTIKIYTQLSTESIKITVVDNGMGISKENMKRISEPFFTTKCRGTGLGVSLSFEIITGHGGTIEYDSEEGRGTSVEINLPIIKEKRLS